MTLPPLLQGPQRGHIDGDRLEINMRQTLLSFWALARVVTITSLTQFFDIRTFIRRCNNYYRVGIKSFLKSNNFFLKRTFAYVFPYAYILLGMDEKAVAWISMHKVQCVSMDR